LQGKIGIGLVIFAKRTMLKVDANRTEYLWIKPKQNNYE